MRPRTAVHTAYGRSRVKDVAAGPDSRGITVQRVGVKDVHLPVRVRRKGAGFDSVLARIDLAAELPAEFRGTHMSRFVDILFQWSQKPISKPDLREMLEEACDRIGARRAQIEVLFKYFITKRSPVSQSDSALDYDCRFEGSLDGDAYVFSLGVEVPVTILCPCSKEISRHGAHNQRAVIKARIRSRPDVMIWIEDLVSLLEGQGSAEIFPLLKREDERFVTEAAYDNPKFVEDVVRDVVGLLRTDERITWFQVSCESLESIHNHTVYAFQEEDKQKPAFEGASAPRAAAEQGRQEGG
jgi:GTP cyclohydrolase I